MHGLDVNVFIHQFLSATERCGCLYSFGQLNAPKLNTALEERVRRHNFTLWSPQLHALREITLCVSVFDVILSATAKIMLAST